MKRFTLIAMVLAACGTEEPQVSQTHSVVVRALTFAREEPAGVSLGLDLDGFVSTDNDDRSCDKIDFVDPEGRPGIDNELGRLFPLIDLAGENALQGLIQGAINEGQVLLFLEAVDFGDGHVELTSRRGMDRPLLGTDSRILSGQTLALDPEPLLGQTTGTKDETGTIVTEPFALKLPIIVFSLLYVVEIPKTILRFRFDEEGNIQGGLIAGGVPVDQLMKILTQASEFGGDFEGLFGDALANSADLDRDETGKCTSTSIAVGFDAAVAFTFE